MTRVVEILHFKVDEFLTMYVSHMMIAIAAGGLFGQGFSCNGIGQVLSKYFFLNWKNYNIC